MDKKEALENLDLILLCLDEIVDGGYDEGSFFFLKFSLYAFISCIVTVYTTSCISYVICFPFFSGLNHGILILLFMSSKYQQTIEGNEGSSMRFCFP